MEYFNQNKQNQRNTERSVVLFYSFYTINLCLGAVRHGWDPWIIGFLLANAAAAWIFFLSKYKNFRTRAVITAVLIQFSIILYSTHKESLTSVIPTFMALSVLVAFYGYTKLLWLTLASLSFVLFYHGVITDTIYSIQGENMLHLLTQTGNIFCLEYVVYIWMKRQNENNNEIYEIVEALVEAEQSKDDFLSNVSHEIRTPVNTICGMSELALREHDLEKMRDEIFDIRDAGRNLMTLVSDILDFAQLQQGKINLEEEAYNITSTINDIINMAMARKGGKQIELIVDCAADIPSGLFGDEKKIRRVIMNLVDNAIKFTNEGCVSIEINARKENYGVNLCVSVKDTGIGMSEESLEKLFESFSQVDTRRNRQEGGIGLGLAIARALVLKMGGTITVRSRLGKGTVMRFVVPQKVLSEEPIASAKDREHINVATYIDMEQFHMTFIRDEYTDNIVHMQQRLQVKCHMCRNFAELKRRENHEKFSHIFISMVEYLENRSYFDELSKRTKLILVIDRADEKQISNPNILRLYKPFYILPVVSILNGSTDNEGGKQMVRPEKFTAPGVHVLVVDDNLMNIRVIEGLLKEYQIKVTYATSGQEALKVVENASYDFIFMDHMMPEMDGIETLHRIRNKVGLYYQKVPIIALTANAAPGNREMFLEEGFDDFVAKPVETSVLERVLKRNLPGEKLNFQTRPETHSEVEKEPFAVGDLDVRQALLYCGGRDQYLDILNACVSKGAEERRHLEQLFKQQDWTDYVIKIHALKSTMHSIGAAPLAAMAKALETAGKKDDIEYILRHHGEMIAEHCRVMAELEQCPLLHPALADEETSENRVKTDSGTIPSDRPELDETAFDRLLAELEDAAYALDGEHMLAVLSKLQEYRYGDIMLREKLEPVRKKIEMSDYMAALETVSGIRSNSQHTEEGDSAK